VGASASPDERRKRNEKKRSKKARKRGGQPGHGGAHRELLPPDRVSKVVDVYPLECENLLEATPAGGRTLPEAASANRGAALRAGDPGERPRQGAQLWAMERRQMCWAHRLRKFVLFSERDGPAAAVGRELFDYNGIVFEDWHDYKAGKLTREHKAALWTFVDHEGVEPTNNHAEREIRAFVLWRKRSFGTQSARGHTFAENLMTVARTARKQRRNVLAFLSKCCEAQRDKTPRRPGSTPSPSEPTPSRRRTDGEVSSETPIPDRAHTTDSPERRDRTVKLACGCADVGGQRHRLLRASSARRDVLLNQLLDTLPQFRAAVGVRHATRIAWFGSAPPLNGYIAH
jgi:hypothetical protein